MSGPAPGASHAAGVLRPTALHTALALVPEAQHEALLSDEASRVRALMQTLPITAVAALQSVWQTHSLVAAEACAEKLNRFRSRLVASAVNGDSGLMREVVVDQNNQRVFPYTYQLDATLKLIENGSGTDFAHRHATLLLLWETGAGKTIWGAHAVAAAYRFGGNPNPFKGILIVPKGAVQQWKRAVETWMCLQDKKVLVATSPAKLTLPHIADAFLIITTPSTVKEVYTEYMGYNEKAVEVLHPGRRPTWLGRHERLQRPTEKWMRKNPDWDPSIPPPVPALFSLPKLDLVILDEATDFRNRDTLTSQAARQLTANSCYAALLSATPVANNANEFADLLYTLAAQPLSLQQRDSYSSNGANGFALKFAGIKKAHEVVVHRVTKAMLPLPDVTTKRVVFNPFVGRCADKAAQAETVSDYNRTVAEAKQSAARVSQTDPQSRSDAHASSRLMACFGKLDQLCFDATLGKKGAAAYDQADVAASLAKPSESLLLLHKVVTEIQAVGRRRVLCFCPLLKVVMVARAFFDSRRQTGTSFQIDGKTSSSLRDATVKKFLAQKNKAVLFATKAVSNAMNIDDGCETVVMFGSSGWSPDFIEQSVGRIVRVTQKYHCLQVHLIPFGGASNAQLTELQTDKSCRLQAAFHDLDFTSFKKRSLRAFVEEEEEDAEYDENAEEHHWRKRQKMASCLCFVDDEGNAIPSTETRLAVEETETGESQADDVALFTSVPKLAKDLPLPAWPERGNPRF